MDDSEKGLLNLTGKRTDERKPGSFGFWEELVVMYEKQSSEFVHVHVPRCVFRLSYIQLIIYAGTMFEPHESSSFCFWL